jgi:peptide/nickel transport system substrate-binding protein
MISRYIPGRELLMVRNPRFREWPAAAQPASYPDRILIRLGLSGARAAAAVADGRSDFLPSIGQFPSGAAYFKNYRSQLRINPQLTTAFLFLNVNVPPFTDLRVRQGVNLALDRGLVVAGWGGPLAARPACQTLPPGLAGYRGYCPWTRNPAADGRWRAPDLPRARRLVAASGTAGMKVTVWDVSPSPEGAIKEAVETVRALRQLGYRASLRLLPPSTYFAVTSDSRNHAQVVDGGWSADYASADDFIGKLTCAYFAPGDSVATDDADGFCDPGLDRQIARAAAEQTSNPAAAAAQCLGAWEPTCARGKSQVTDLRQDHSDLDPIS